LVQLELAFLEDIFYKKCDDEEQEITNSKLAKKRTMKKGDAPPANLLLNEKINAKMFQAKLKRQGIELSLWEVFTLFEYLNTVIAKQNFYEPLRYH
jgi:dephospho-CoA kinase